LVNTVLLWVLTEAVGLHPLIAAVLATEAAILSNFLLNDRSTFQEATASVSWTRRAFRYNCGALAGLVISVGVLALLTRLGMYYLVANLLAIGVAMVWNYAVSCLFTWSTPEIDAHVDSVRLP
jgi:putative flippase GtrA